MNNLEILQEWYYSNCDGDWEHQQGIKIDTLDNPGWAVKIDLLYTKWEKKDYVECEIDIDDDLKWISCKKEKDTFIIACGPKMLDESIGIFIKWINE